jgi:hypothetical protein
MAQCLACGLQPCKGDLCSPAGYSESTHPEILARSAALLGPMTGDAAACRSASGWLVANLRCDLAKLDL